MGEDKSTGDIPRGCSWEKPVGPGVPLIESDHVAWFYDPSAERGERFHCYSRCHWSNGHYFEAGYWRRERWDDDLTIAEEVAGRLYDVLKQKRGQETQEGVGQ